MDRRNFLRTMGAVGAAGVSLPGIGLAKEAEPKKRARPAVRRRRSRQKPRASIVVSVESGFQVTENTEYNCNNRTEEDIRTKNRASRVKTIKEYCEEKKFTSEQSVSFIEKLNKLLDGLSDGHTYYTDGPAHSKLDRVLCEAVYMIGDLRKVHVHIATPFQGTEWTIVGVKLSRAQKILDNIQYREACPG